MSETVASELEAGDTCAARVTAEKLHQRTIGAINAGRVPARYQEELTAAVGTLVSSISCTVTPPTTPESAAPDDGGDDGDEDDEDEGKGNGKKKGKGGKKGKG